MRRLNFVALCLWAGGLLACSSNLNLGPGVKFQDSAEANYLKGMAELKDESYPEAHKFFNHVKSKFPFSRYATLAELRIADTYLAEEKYVDAIDAYKQFAKFHPTHPEVKSGYAAFRAAEGYVLQIPSDWFIFPAAYEKDQSPTRDALRELSLFIKTFTGSKYLPRAKERYRDCLRRLADHELYVARYYLEEDKPRASILRLETILSTYSEAGMDTQVMLLLGQTYLKLKERGKARQTFSRMVKDYPQDPYSAKARLYLEHLDRTAQ